MAAAFLKRSIRFGFVLALLLASNALGQVSMRSNDTSNTSSKQFFYHWDGFEVQWYGPGIAFVENGDLSGFPASPRNFIAAYTGNTFAYTMTAVSNWDTV